MKKSIILLSLFLVAFGNDWARGQNDVMVITQVLPPYSPYFSDYTSYDNRVVITLNNLDASGATQNVRLTASITGNNGVNLALSASFIPPQPITLLPGTSVRLTGSQLMDYFDINAWDVSGISTAEILRGNGLPQGDYELCIQALDFDTGVALSMPAPSGCAFFNISSVEPPILIQPMCGEEITTSNPQNMLFSWAVPAGANPQQVEYELVIQEVFNNMDPNQLFLALPTTPFFQKIVPNNVYLYNLADPSLETGRTYAFRVTAINKEGFVDANGNSRPLNFRNGGSSEVCTFIYGKQPEDNEPDDFADNGPKQELVEIVLLNVPKDQVKVNNQGQNAPPDPDDSLDCIAQCEVPQPGNQNLVSNLSPGEKVIIGKFKMEILQASFTGSGFSGEGSIMVNFLDIPIRVAFNNLKVNTDKTVFQGQATAVADGGLPPNADFLTTEVITPNISQAVFQNAKDFIEANDRKIHLLENTQQAMGMPLSWEIDNASITLLGMIFSATGAHLNMAAGFALPEAMQDNIHLLLTGSNCIRPNGFGNQGQMSLSEEVAIPISPAMQHILKQGTSISYNCDGIQTINLVGAIEFGRELLLPLNGEGNVIEGNVRADYETEVVELQDWTLEIESLNHPFTVPGLVGFSIDAQNLILDQSTTNTPQQADEPASWTGIYLGNLAITFPDFFQKNGNPVVKNIENFTLDKNGVSGTIGPFENLIASNENDVSGWPISVNNFSITLENNNLDGVSVTGGLQLPIAETDLGYIASIAQAENPEDPLEMQFNVSTEEDLEVPMWFAQLNLEEGSTVTLEKSDNNWIPAANLNGSIRVGWEDGNGPDVDNLVSAFDLPEVTFDQLSITPGENNIPNINFENFGVINGQASIANFSFGLNEPDGITVQNMENGDLGLTFNLYAHLGQENFEFGGSTKFTIWGKLQGNTYTYKRTELQAIGISADLNVATIDGNLEIFSSDPVYGNGFKGAVDVELNQMDLGFGALFQVGAVKDDNDETYPYFYSDSYAKIDGSGIPIPPTPFAIYGGSGGFWLNMQKENDDNAPEKTINDLKLEQELTQNEAVAMKPGTTRFDDDKKVPFKGGIGFDNSVVVGITTAETLFNADLGFGMEVDLDGSYGSIWMDGQGYVVQEMENRGEAFIQGNVALEIGFLNDNNDSKDNIFFDNTSTLNIDILDGLVTGEGTLHLYADKHSWFHKLGYWENAAEPWLDNPPRVGLTLGEFEGLDTELNDNAFNAYLHSYFMFGPDIPGLPQLPDLVRNNNDFNYQMPNERSQVFSKAGDSPGLALGSGLYIDTDLEFLIFYLKAKHAAGFDFTLRQEDGLCAGNFGLNNWYARGQAYGYFQGDAGVELDLWVWKGDLSFMELEAVAKMDAGLPNPIYLNGDVAMEGSVLDGIITFDLDFEFELGEACQNANSGPFDEYPIIADVIPDDKAEKVHLFTQLEAAFNFPNAPFSYTEFNKKGKQITRTFTYELDFVRLEWSEEGKKKTQNFVPEYRSDGNSAVFFDENFVFQPETAYTFSIGATGYELLNGGAKEERTAEIKTVKFTTDKAPSKINEKDILLSTPFIGENYFIPSNFSTGNIVMYQVGNHWTDPSWWYTEGFALGDSYQGELAHGSFDFIARFIDVKSKAAYESPFQVNNGNGQGLYGGQLAFALPKELQTNRIYELQLLVKYTPPINDYVPASNTQAVYQDVLLGGAGKANKGGAGGNMNAGQGWQVLQGNLNLQNNNLNFQNNGNSKTFSNTIANQPPKPNPIFEASLANANSGNQNISIKRKHQELLTVNKTRKKVEWPIFEGFKFYFKTSQFNTLAAKLSNITLESTEIGNYYTHVADVENVGSFDFENIKLPTAILRSDENFDERTVATAINDEKEPVIVSKPPLIELSVTGQTSIFANEGISWGEDDPYTPNRSNLWGAVAGNTTQALLKTYHFPMDDSDWKMRLQSNDYDYPSIDYWEKLLPSRETNTVWNSNRYTGEQNNQYQPFNDKYYPNVYEAIANMNENPLIVFLTAHKNIEHQSYNGNKVGFTTKKLQYPPGNNNNGGGGGMWIQNNQWQNQNPQQQEAYFGILDYTEWLAVQDWFRLKQYLFKRWSEVVQPDVMVKEGVRQFIKNKMPYGMQRREGSPPFRIQKYNGGPQKDFYFQIPPDLNIDID
ncbi:MAG: hypothetical protein AAFU57_04525 [Bacteroidota bacterium]